VRQACLDIQIELRSNVRRRETTVTGPSKPDGNSGELALYGFTSAKAILEAPGCSSPMSRFTHAFTTFTWISFVPGLSAEVTSRR